MVAPEQGSSKSGGARLAGEEVLELTTFAEKKAWIESKISFLSSLPPIEVVSPSPPSRSPTSKRELESWWAEHDRIEQEVDEYDMGDLEKMRRFARDKSKQALSPRDMDLIEITLTTLFAVDKLLHLLRNRRKSLVLLGYRLQWEDVCAAAWTSRQQLVDDLLPSFLSKTRWTIPHAVSSPSRHPSDEPTPSLSLSASTASLSSSTSSRRLSALASSTSSGAASSSSSAISRNMRSQMLRLSLSQLTSHLRTLTTSLTPATGTLLDKLIDSSPSPLPDSFLDEQDRLELDVGRATKGTREFAEEMGRQWKAADEVFWAAHEVEQEAAALAVEAENAIPLLPSLPPDLAADTSFSSRLATLSYSLSPLRTALASLPSPSHSLAPSQPTSETPHLLRTLEKNLSRASGAVSNAEEAVRRWKGAKKACEQAEKVRRELEGVRGRLEEGERGLRGMGEEEGRPKGPEDGVACLERRQGENEWEERWDALLRPLLPLLETGGEGHSLLRSAADALGALASSGGAGKELRKEVRELAHVVRAGMNRVIGMKEEEERRRRAVGVGRRVREVVQEGRERVEEAGRKVKEAVGREKWVEGPERDERRVPLDAERLVGQTKEAVEATVSPALDAAVQLLSSSSANANLLTHLQQLVSSLRADTAALAPLVETLSAVRAQAKAVREFEAGVGRAKGEMENVRARAEVALSVEEGREEAGRVKGDVEKDVKVLAEAVERLVDGVKSVPFLSSAPSPASLSPSPPSSPSSPSPPAQHPDLDLDLPAFDSSVRYFLNRTSASLQGQVDDLRRLLGLLEHKGKVEEWDEEAEKVEVELEEVERKARAVDEKVAVRADDAEATLFPLLSQLSAIDFFLPSTSLSQLSSSFANLLSSPASSAQPFNAHLARRSRLDSLSFRHEAAQSSASSTTDRLLAARAAREARVREWEAERDRLVTELGERSKLLEAVEAEANALEERLSSARTRAAAEREELLLSSALDEMSDVPLLEADEAASAISSLASRLRTEQDALSSVSSTLASLQSSFPSLHTPSADLTPASSALEFASSLSSSASSTQSRLSSFLSSLDSDSAAFRARRDEELARRRHEAEEAKAAQFGAWRKAVDVLSERVEADRAAVERVAEDARVALSALESRTEERKQDAEALLAPPELGEEAAYPGAGVAEEYRSTLERLQNVLREKQQDGKELEGRAGALEAEEPAKEEEGAPAVDDLRELLRSFSPAVEAAEAALEFLTEGVEHAERDEAEWAGRRDAELEWRKVEEEERHTAEVSINDLRRSSALPRLSIDGIEEEPDDPFARSSPSNPFGSSGQPAMQEPSEVQQLRAGLAAVTALDWLDPAVLQLPSSADAVEVEQQVSLCRQAFDALEALSSDVLVWTDVDGLKADVVKKEEASTRVTSLADFGGKVEAADQALSNLLDSIDASTPGIPLPDDASAIVPLPEAISAASNAVTVVRHAAIPLVDDARVKRGIQRIEETWSEMMSMVEPPRASSSASTASTASRRNGLNHRISDSTSSRASSRTSTRTPSVRVSSRPQSQASSIRPSTRPSSRPSLTSSSTRVPRPAPARPDPSASTFLVSSTPRKAAKDDPFTTPIPRRRVQSGLPRPSSIKRTVSPLPPLQKATPTVMRPFSFNTPKKADLARSTSSIPRRTPSTASRRDSIASVASSLFSPASEAMRRVSSTESRTSTSSRRESLASSVSSSTTGDRRSGYGTLPRSPRPSLSSSVRSTPPKKPQQYHANAKNQLDRAVGKIVNSLNVHVPIEVAEGRWTDESGMYLIGGRLYFCRVLRTAVLVRVGGGYQSLEQFILTHFGNANGLTISPSTSLKKNLAEPEWISSQTVRDTLSASQSSSSIRDFLSSSLSSTDLSSATASLSMSRSFGGGSTSGTPLRRSFGGAGMSLSSLPLSPSSSSATPKSRPSLPIWRP
ncbi:hypothetical protein JCM8547_004711 [Rhodosporidiobolus lusitaniae]